MKVQDRIPLAHADGIGEETRVSAPLAVADRPNSVVDMGIAGLCRALPLILFLALAVVTFFGYSFGRHYIATDRHNPLLVVDSNALNFGTVRASREFVWQIPITNTSSHAVQVVDMKTSCGCTRVSPTSFSLSSNETVSVDVVLDLSLQTDITSSESEVPFAVNLAPIVSGSTLPQPYWTLRGTVTLPCTLTSSRIVFAGSDAIVQGTPPVMQAVFGQLRDKRLRIGPVPSDCCKSVDVKSVDPHGRFVISVTPNTNRDIGWFDAPLKFLLVDPSGVSSGDFEVRLVGEVVPAFMCYPRVIAIGSVPLGTSVVRTITVDGAGGQLLDASPLAPHVNVTTRPLPNGDFAVEMAFEVTDDLPSAFDIHLVYELSNGEVAMCVVPVWCRGI